MTVTTPLYAMLKRLGQLALQDGAKPSPQTHFELLQMIDQLKLAVETPTETVLRLIYQVNMSLLLVCLIRHSFSDDPQPPQNAALRCVIDMGIFPLLIDKQHLEGGVSAAQLAEYTGAEQDLIGKESLSLLDNPSTSCVTTVPGGAAVPS
jgi:hypothetical protein